MSKFQVTLSTRLACCALLAGAGFALAQAPAARETRRPAVHIERVTQVIGTQLVLRDNASIGKIEDIVLSEDGCVEYLVVSYSEKYVLVPWSVAKVDVQRKVVAVDIAKDRFMEVPTFSRDQWPSFQDGQYIEKVRTIYNVPAAGPERRQERREERREERKGAPIPPPKTPPPPPAN
jgi:PRC-barrel domain